MTAIEVMADLIRENNRYAAWERLRAAARDVLHCLDTPRPDLVGWIGRFDDAQSRATAAAAEIGLPYRANAHTTEDASR